MGILASAGGYVFGKKGRDYDLQNVGVTTRGAIEGLSEIITLIHAGVLPKSVSYSAVEDLMGRGKLAMMISGPWAWLNLMKTGINFGVAHYDEVMPNVPQMGRFFSSLGAALQIATNDQASPEAALLEAKANSQSQNAFLW